MRKNFLLLLITVFASSFFSLRAEALTAPESLEAFITVEERFLHSLMHSGALKNIGDEEALPLYPVYELRGKFRPLFNLGRSKDSMEREKAQYGWKRVTYQENGHRFRIVCDNLAVGREVFEGTYDPATDHFLCKKTSGEGSPGGIYEDFEIEYRRVDSGYIARFASYTHNAVHKLVIKGNDGIISFGETKFDSLWDSFDFPKEGMAWYEVRGNRFNFQPWQGQPREYTMKR